MGAELWQMMGRSEVVDEALAEADPRFLSGEMVELAVQINARCGIG
jgi:leucyl-tRNA synthetase